MSYSAPFIESEEVVHCVRDPSKVPGKDYLVVDVRDNDFHGGNIPGAINVPANQLVDRGNALIEKYKQVPLVVFHCALSQQRGPKAARIYNEMRHLTGEKGDQKVVVMRGGFDGWHARYHKEKDLIANYEPSIWGVFEEEEEEDQETVENNPFMAGVPKSSS
ncbi:Rhodanese-like domain-containing protein [Zychaea mexicana]|uniref:Rhodanese-like domain-containing protein n=1 Tax=Zychaea mexicana TaxID=64656 RepID=UPI0022FE994C|nr:Rhodanese-like domain-containing protein [Zychaea mexicana]KAI9484462.1 Rhodanese-like domain-containing protein [Zychaea mexicana]